MKRLLLLLALILAPQRGEAIVCSGNGPCTVTVKTTGGDYTSLNAALVGESADLVTNTRLLTIECYNSTGTNGADTTAANTGTGYTPSADYYINIVAPSGYRHAGVWDSAKYHMFTTTTSLTIAESYTRFTGLQFKSNNGLNVYAVLLSAAENVTGDTVIATSEGTNTARYGFGMVGVNSLLQNAVAYRFGRLGVECGGAGSKVVNSTFYNAGFGLYRAVYASLYCELVNVLSTNNNGPDYGFAGSNVTTNCAGEDETVDDGASETNVRTLQTFTFVDAGAYNFKLASNDTGALGYGTSTGAPAYDIAGVERGATIDIGAWQTSTDGGGAVGAPSFGGGFGSGFGGGLR